MSLKLKCGVMVTAETTEEIAKRINMLVDAGFKIRGVQRDCTILDGENAKCGAVISCLVDRFDIYETFRDTSGMTEGIYNGGELILF